MEIELVWDVARPCGSPRGGSGSARERERERDRGGDSIWITVLHAIFTLSLSKIGLGCLGFNQFLQPMKLLCMTSSASMGEDGLREENEKPADVGFLSTLTHSRAMSLWSCMYQAHNSCTCMTDYSVCILSLHLVL